MSDLNLAVAPAFLPVSFYKLIPKGLQVPEPKRAVNLNSISKLEVIFEEWKQKEKESLDFDIKYKLAVELTGNWNLLLEDINSFWIRNQDQDQHPTGLFISALYNKLPEKIIVYDLKLDENLKLLGYNLPKDKVLVITGNAGNLGEQTRGVIIVTDNAETGGSVGEQLGDLTMFIGDCKSKIDTGKYGAHGSIIAGKNATVMASGIRYDNFFITGNAKVKTLLTKEPVGYWDLRKKNNNVAAKLDIYLDYLNRIFTGTASEITKKAKSLGESPADKIRDNIYSILREGGYRCLSPC